MEDAWMRKDHFSTDEQIQTGGPCLHGEDVIPLGMWNVSNALPSVQEITFIYKLYWLKA